MSEDQSARVTVAGGGVAALELVLALRELVPQTAVEILAPKPESAFRPLAVLVPFALGDPKELDLERFASQEGASVVRDTLVAVDADKRTLRTGRGEERPFDLLVVAAGARAVEAVPGAVLFRGPGDERRLGLLFEEYAAGDLRRLAFAVPSDIAWSLPAYELALLSASELAAREVRGAQITIVTPEPSPLALFGERASAAVSGLLDQAGVQVMAGVMPERAGNGRLETSAGEIEADRVVALPRLHGPGFPGLPSDDDGFVLTDWHGQVQGLDGVYAAGDVVSFPIKQGGLAAQQADAVADSIAARLGADVEPDPFRPVLRGMLLAGESVQYLERTLEGEGESAVPALWRPESKVFGRHLLRYLGADDAPALVPTAAETEAGVPVEAELDAP